jgi:calcineurin-like phosphoesterase family protein
MIIDIQHSTKESPNFILQSIYTINNKPLIRFYHFHNKSIMGKPDQYDAGVWRVTYKNKMK